MTSNIIHILQVDDRSGYRKDSRYPHWIFLGTVLRWSVCGNVILDDQKRPPSEVIVSQNDCALDSTAAFLADHIESGRLPILNVHTRLPLGGVEMRAIVEKLRLLDGGLVGGLVNEAGLNYYLGGHQLYQLICDVPQSAGDDPDDAGRVWHRLMSDAPSAWRGTPQSTALEEIAVATPTSAPKDWTDSARAIADELSDRDTANNCRDSLKGYCPRVMAEMRKRGISGPRGPLVNPKTIQRDALQGDLWWGKKAK